MAAARWGAALYPNSLGLKRGVAQALIGLGRLEEVDSVVGEIEATGGNGVQFRVIGEELRAHGYPDAAARMFDRGIAWHESQAGDAPPDRLSPNHIRALYAAGRGEEAIPAITFVLDSVPDLSATVAAELRGWLGLTAAKRGDRDEALRQQDEIGRITTPYIQGANKLWQARIAATLGDREVAVNFLRDAFREGLDITPPIFDHDMNLDSLRDYQPFIDLIRPKR